MTKDELDAIRARVAFAHAEFNSPHDSVCGDLYVQDTTRLLAEVERLRDVLAAVAAPLSPSAHDLWAGVDMARRALGGKR